jgi:hypothetical protein
VVILALCADGKKIRGKEAGRMLRPVPYSADQLAYMQVLLRQIDGQVYASDTMMPEAVVPILMDAVFAP